MSIGMLLRRVRTPVYLIQSLRKRVLSAGHGQKEHGKEEFIPQMTNKGTFTMYALIAAFIHFVWIPTPHHNRK